MDGKGRMIASYSILVVCFSALACTSASSQSLPIPCSADQVAIFQGDIDLMKEGLTEFIADVESGEFRATGLMVRWLGAKDAEDASALVQRLRDVVDFSFLTEPLCYPTEDSPNSDGEFIVAQVLEDSFYLYLLGDYFELETEGLYSRSGTLLHELLHLDFFGATNSDTDEVYDVEEALALAINEPDTARKNSRNWEMMFNEHMTGDSFGN